MKVGESACCGSTYTTIQSQRLGQAKAGKPIRVSHVGIPGSGTTAFPCSPAGSRVGSRAARTRINTEIRDAHIASTVCTYRATTLAPILVFHQDKKEVFNKYLFLVNCRNAKIYRIFEISLLTSFRKNRKTSELL